MSFIPVTNPASLPITFKTPVHGNCDGIGVTVELGIKNSFDKLSASKYDLRSRYIEPVLCTLFCV